MKIGREINCQSWTFSDSFFFLNASPSYAIVQWSDSGPIKTENLSQHKRLNSINFTGDSQHEERLPQLLRACRQNPLIADRSPLIADRSWKIFPPLAIYVAGLVLVAYVSGNHPSNGISWFPRSSPHQIPPNLICHSPPPCRLSSSSALWWDEPQPASRDIDHLNPHWATLLTHLARERALCAAPSTHLLASSVILSFLIISRHPLYLIILHRWSRNRAKACPASPWLGHPGGRVGNQEHTGDQSFLLLFISSQPLCLHS